MEFQSKAGPYIRMAHRVMWEEVNGPIPEGLFACHKCDTPSCVRPEHLFLGTQKDNMHDMRRKGRGTQGDTHPSKKYPEKWKELGRGKGMNRMGLRIVPPELRPRGEKNKRSRVTAVQVIEIRELSKVGMSHLDIAKKFNIGKTTVGHILRGRTWAHLTGLDVL